MKTKNKYIALMIITGIIGYSSNTYAMPLPTVRLIPTANMSKILATDMIKVDLITTLAVTTTSISKLKPESPYDTVVNKAKEYLGVPYVWGGTSSSGFDCSGLVQYVYKQIGISISRTTYTQVNEGVEVDQNNLRQGDLVFFGRNGDVHHVGIYIGNEQYIHAPQTGEVVKISNLSDRNDYYTARRIIND